MAANELKEFLARDETRFVETLADDIERHVSGLDSPIAGYAILTGSDHAVLDLMAAVLFRADLPSVMSCQQFDVADWTMCPQAIGAACDALEELNAEFARLHTPDPDEIEEDEFELAFRDKLHGLVVSAIVTAQARVEVLQNDDVFKVFTICDSDLDIDAQSSERLNGAPMHKRYLRWR